MQFSVLMSVRNGEKFIRKALTSVLEQSFTAFEFIIIDNGSSDSTPEILKQYTDKRVKIHTLSLLENYSLGEALNVGLSICNGKFICRIDADDVWLPDKLERAVPLINNGARVIGTGCITVLSSTNRSYNYGFFSFKTRLVLGLGYPPHSSMVFDKILATSLGGYETQWKRAEDIALWLKMLRSGSKFVVDSKKLVLVEKRWESLSQGAALIEHLTDVAEARWAYLLDVRIISKRRYSQLSLKAYRSKVWRIFYFCVNAIAYKRSGF